MSTTTEPTPAERKIRREKVLDIAMIESIKWSIGATIVAGAATALATARSKKFATLMSVSAKASLPVMAGMGTFAIAFEKVQYAAMMHPDKWGLEEYIPDGKVSTMPFHHRAINYLYDNPFYFVAGMGFPFAGYVLKENMKLTNLTLSQKVMQSRVIAQGGVLVILLTTMAFRGYMDKRGRYPEPSDEPVSAAKAQEEVVDYSPENSANHKGNKKMH